MDHPRVVILVAIINAAQALKSICTGFNLVGPDTLIIGGIVCRLQSGHPVPFWSMVYSALNPVAEANRCKVSSASET